MKRLSHGREALIAVLSIVILFIAFVLFDWNFRWWIDSLIAQPQWNQYEDCSKGWMPSCNKFLDHMQLYTSIVFHLFMVVIIIPLTYYLSKRLSRNREFELLNSMLRVSSLILACFFAAYLADSFPSAKYLSLFLIINLGIYLGLRLNHKNLIKQ